VEALPERTSEDGEQERDEHADGGQDRSSVASGPSSTGLRGSLRLPAGAG
jgi:hypothetical protein